MKAALKSRNIRVKRRAVLGAAAVGGAAVATARLLGFPDLGQYHAGVTAARAGFDWMSPLQSDVAKVAHLLRRAAFGASPAEIEASASDGYARTVDRLIETPPAIPADLPSADAATQQSPLRLNEMQQWWLGQMLSTKTPLVERMTLFWHGHFTSDYRKVGVQSPYLYWQNRTWRKLALGDLKTMLFEVTVDPAMLRYLDLGTSTGQSPNENYSRELMELFTMGAGTFGEDDVRAGAKALAGWRLPVTQAMVNDIIEQSIKRTGKPPARSPVADSVQTGVFDIRRAYSGTVTFLGKQDRWDTPKVVDRILEQSSVAPFIARKVLREFAMPEPEEAYVNRLADRFRKSGYKVKDLVRDVFTSDEFLSPASYRSLVKSPIEYMLHTAKMLQLPKVANLIPVAGDGMGQRLFDPPDVGGWPHNESWISSSTMLARVNFATTVVAQAQKLPPVDDAIAKQLDQTLSPQTAKLLNDTADEKRRWLLVLASPEFQLK